VGTKKIGGYCAGISNSRIGVSKTADKIRRLPNLDFGAVFGETPKNQKADSKNTERASD